MIPNTKIPQIKLVFDRKSVADDFKDPKRKKKGLLQIEIYFKGKRKWISTGVKLYRGQWNESKGGVINHPDSSNKNAEIMRLMSTINNNIRKQFDNTGDFSFESIASCKNDIDIMSVILTVQEESKSAGHKYQTWSKFKAIIKWLGKYNKIKEFSDLTPENILDFKNFLISEHLAGSTIERYLGSLSQVCQWLCCRDKIDRNPFDKISIKLAKNSKIRYLNEAELEKLRNTEVKSRQERYALDFFLLQTMTGMAFVDLKNLNLKEHVNKVCGKYVVNNLRQKTGTQFTIQIVPQAYDIIERYGGQMNKIISVATLNYHLKKIGIRTLNKPLSTHMGRHTFATWAISKGVPIEYVSKMLGHSDIHTTQRYAKVLAEDVIKEFDKLEEALKK